MNKSVGFDLKPLPFWLKVPTVLAKELGIAFPRLTPENLIKAASRNASLPACLPAKVEEALEVLCRSLTDDAQLHWFGKMNYWNMIVTGLSGLLEVEQAFVDDPSLINTKLINPLIVVGLPRSGTTFLHRLLSCPENAKGIELYRHLYPVAKQPDLRKLYAFAIFEPFTIASSVYNMDAIHYMRPNLPEECIFSLRLSIQSTLFWSIAPTYSYLSWLLDQDLRETYEFYRKVLILYQKQLPGKCLTLKCPDHVAWLPSLVEALPEAHIVQTHRDPLETLASDCKLTLSLHGLATDSLDWRKIVNHVYLKERTYAQRSVDFANSIQGQKVFHVDYRNLVKEPENVVHQIYENTGIPFSDHDLETVKQYVLSNKQHKHGRNSYSLEQFELSPQQIMDTFKDYRERFINNP